jgi:hypothetical protein
VAEEICSYLLHCSRLSNSDYAGSGVCGALVMNGYLKKVNPYIQVRNRGRLSTIPGAGSVVPSAVAPATVWCNPENDGRIVHCNCICGDGFS